MSAKLHITEVGRVAVPASDQDRALEFYVGTLGFELRSDVTFADGKMRSRFHRARVDRAAPWRRPTSSTGILRADRGRPAHRRVDQRRSPAGGPCRMLGSGRR